MIPPPTIPPTIPPKRLRAARNVRASDRALTVREKPSEVLSLELFTDSHRKKTEHE